MVDPGLRFYFGVDALRRYCLLTLARGGMQWIDTMTRRSAQAYFDRCLSARGKNDRDVRSRRSRPFFRGAVCGAARCRRHRLDQ